VSIARLPEAQESVGKLVQEGQVNRRLSEKWRFYREPNTDLPEARTIFIVAIPQPITRLYFTWQGRDYPAEVAPTYFCLADERQVEGTLGSVLKNAGYRIVRARLPLKTLAARSGLAKYGKNNLVYVPGMGSLCRLIAFYSDIPCEEDSWQEPEMMPSCEKCTLCRAKCANGSITPDHFLIHAENCLGFLNQTEPNVPYWATRQPDWLSAFIGCMCCQSACPVNKLYLHNIKDHASFSEEETALILNRAPWDKLFPEMQQKLDGIRGIYSSLASNLSALMEKQHPVGYRHDSGHDLTEC